MFKTGTFKTKAMIHSLKAQDEVTILHERGNNDVVAEYQGTRCTAIFNPFSGLFYADDIYGVLSDPNKCPNCGEYVGKFLNRVMLDTSYAHYI